MYHFKTFIIFTFYPFCAKVTLLKIKILLESIFTLRARSKMFKTIFSFVELVYFRENFENLLDDAKFKTEIVLFSIDHENSIISTEHREQVLPILMR